MTNHVPLLIEPGDQLLSCMLQAQSGLPSSLQHDRACLSGTPPDHPPGVKHARTRIEDYHGGRYNLARDTVVPWAWYRGGL